SRSCKTAFRQCGIVVAMNDVVGDSGMVRLLFGYGFENLAAFAVVGKRLVGARRRKFQGERVEDFSFGVGGISSRKLSHFPFERLRVSRRVTAVLRIDFAEGFDITVFARRCSGVC